MVTEAQIQLATRRIVDGYVPDQVILFGSYAYGEPTEFSDLDLLVVKNEDDSPVRERRQLLKRLLYAEPWEIDVDIAPLNAADLVEAGRNRCRREYVALQRGRILHGTATRPAAVPADASLSAEEKYTIRQLVKLAEQDLQAARLAMLQLDYYDMVARTNQSAAEKLLKARLLSLRAQLPSGHDLNRLLAAVARLENVEPAVWRKAELLAPFAVLFHDYFFKMKNPPTQLALHEAAVAIYQVFTPRIQQSLA